MRDVLKQIITGDFSRLAMEMIKQLRHFENAEQMVESRLRLLLIGLAEGK